MVIIDKEKYPIRLNKYLAFKIGISRRQADIYINEKRVSINNKTARIGMSVHRDDKVLVDSKPIINNKKYTYLLLNKPINFVCSRKQQGPTKTIYSIIPKQFQKLKTVGRLDKDSSGLIMLTDNGDFAYQLTHPKFRKIKKYLVTLNKPLASRDLNQISEIGVKLIDGISKFVLTPLNKSLTKWLIKMHEGRNRQIRRTFNHLNYDIKQLHRIQFGSIKLSNIKPGEFVVIEDINKIFH